MSKQLVSIIDVLPKHVGEEITIGAWVAKSGKGNWPFFNCVTGLPSSSCGFQN